MKVFSALFSEIKGVFGKAYLLAGLLPGALLVLTIAWFETGSNLRAASRLLIDKGIQDAPDLLATLVLALVLGLAFFAGRAPLMQFVQTMQSPGLGPIRNCLVRRQMARRQRLEKELRRREHEYTVVKWATAGPHDDFSRRTFLPPGYERPTEQVAMAAATRARAVVASVQENNGKGWRRLWAAGLPTDSQASEIIRGLGSLYAYLVSINAQTGGSPGATTAQPAVEAEVAAWRSLREDPSGRGILDALCAGLNAEYVDLRTEREQLPQLDWLRPTDLGARAAALDGYCKDRYGIDTSSLLVRLYSVLSEEDRTGLSDSRLNIEVLLNLSVAAIATAAWTLVLNLQHVWRPPAGTQPGVRSWLFVLVSSALALLFYRAAVFAYEGLREKVVRAVDTSRLAVLKKLGFKLPLDVAEEKALWSSLSEFFVDGVPLNPKYELKPE